MLVVIALVLAALAAALHVYIWWLESMAWTTPAARKVFGTTPEEAEATKFLAFNQGYYNLFLAITTVLALMPACSAALASASAAHRSAALRQGLFPALAVIASAIHLLT